MSTENYANGMAAPTETPANRQVSNDMLVKSDKQPELVALLSSFKNENDRTEEFVNAIKAKLRNIFQYPSLPSEESLLKDKEMIVECAIDEFKLQLRRLRETNRKLVDIMEHTQKII